MWRAGIIIRPTEFCALVALSGIAHVQYGRKLVSVFVGSAMNTTGA